MDGFMRISHEKVFGVGKDFIVIFLTENLGPYFLNMSNFYMGFIGGGNLD
jgi:hypothetical protein